MGQLFQSFWWGQSLSPYEWLSLKSFVDFGHDFDLYTFDPHIAVPAQVRVRNAEELARRDEFFVYEDGFGKGSPAAFSNVFRYRLLAERGGWWVDTDVVCLTDAIPAYSRFLAREDEGLVNTAVMRFESRDPVIVRCLERAVEKGRSIRWGEIGPQLLTQVLRELGQMEHIFDSSVCYPIHYNDATAVLYPSQAERVADRLAGSQFLHLWNSMLADAGVRKSYLPPRGCVLRRLVEQHQVDGWTGEYDEAGLSEATGINARLQAEVARRTELETALREANARLQAEAARRNELATALREANARLQAEAGARGALEETLRAVNVRRQEEAGRRTELETALRAVDARLQGEARQRSELETALGDCVAAGDRLRAERDALLGSTSWRLTAPLRALRRGLSGAGRDRD